MKRNLSIITIVVLAVALSGCSAFDGTTSYTVASRRTFTTDGESNLIFPYYLVKRSRLNNWNDEVRVIKGFDYEAGFEYRIEAKDYGQYNLELVRVLTKEQKESDNLPRLIYNEDWPPLFPADSVDWSQFE